MRSSALGSGSARGRMRARYADVPELRSPPPAGSCNTAAMDEIRIVRDGGVVRLTLNRPDKLNAQTVAMWNHLAKLGAELAADDSIRVLVVAGAGRSFSAG